MENFKKDLFFQEYQADISCQKISEQDALFLTDFLEQQYGINNMNKADFFKILLEKLRHKKEYRSLETSIELEVVFKEFAFPNNSVVFVIWKYPGDIDKFELSYLLKYWEDIWFSTSDEAIGIFFPTMDKLIMITHYYTVYY